MTSFKKSESLGLGNKYSDVSINYIQSTITTIYITSQDQIKAAVRKNASLSRQTKRKIQKSKTKEGAVKGKHNALICQEDGLIIDHNINNALCDQTEAKPSHWLSDKILTSTSDFLTLTSDQLDIKY